MAISRIQHTHTKKKTRSRKNGDKDGKAMYKLMNAVYSKTMDDLKVHSHA